MWSLKGYFDLVDYKIVHDGKRNVYRYILRLSDRGNNVSDVTTVPQAHTRLIPSKVKMEVWKRDKGRCVTALSGRVLRATIGCCSFDDIQIFRQRIDRHVWKYFEGWPVLVRRAVPALVGGLFSSPVRAG